MEEKSEKSKVLQFTLQVFAVILGGICVIGIWKAIEKRNQSTQPKELQEIKQILDSIDFKKEEVHNHYQTNIKNEKKIINQNFAAIDTMPYDSLRELWAVEARQYKPLFN